VGQPYKSPQRMNNLAASSSVDPDDILPPHNAMSPAMDGMTAELGCSSLYVYRCPEPTSPQTHANHNQSTDCNSGTRMPIRYNGLAP
jgi:hypothetical protein